MYQQVLSFLRPVLLAAGVLASASGAFANLSVDFEDLQLDPNSYWNGSDGSGGFTSGGITFLNTFTDSGGGWTSWSGWSYSNTTDTNTPDFSNQYSAYTGSGVDGSANYAVYYDGFWGGAPPTVTGIPAGTPRGAYFTNTTYAALSMRDGDGFAKKFGGADGTDPDWFLLTIQGLDASNQLNGTVDFYLADYRNLDGAPNYIVDEWTWVDLTSLGSVTQLQFILSSSDFGDFGMNTPAYFAMDKLTMDNLTAVPEPSSLLLCGVLVGMLAFGRRCRRRATSLSPIPKQGPDHAPRGTSCRPIIEEEVATHHGANDD